MGEMKSIYMLDVNTSKHRDCPTTTKKQTKTKNNKKQKKEENSPGANQRDNGGKHV